MSDEGVPFLARAAIIEHYAHSAHPLDDPTAVDVVISVLRVKPELRSHFFRCGPSAAWAPILWERGFFSSPPEPEKTEQGYILPHWDVQYYLLSVATQVPEIVRKHVETISGHSWYISLALRALSSIPPSESEEVVPRIVRWLEDPAIAEGIEDEVIDLVDRFAEDERLDAALALFRASTSPRVAPESGGKVPSWGAGGRRVDKRLFGTPAEPSSGIEILKRFRCRAVVDTLENHLLGSLSLEARRIGDERYVNTSWWRNAVEDSDQDILANYNDQVLSALRDTLEGWVRSDPGSVETLLARYLSAPQSILRRIALHILRCFWADYPALFRQELLNQRNVDDISVHHEYFLLLQDGYAHLASSDQQILLALILEGPGIEETRQLAEQARDAYGTDPGQYAARHKKAWIRDRIWMIRDHLTSDTAEYLSRLVEEIGAPDHPAFLAWSTGAFWVRDTSPFAETELETLSPEELVELISKWQPDPEEPFGPERVSYEGLAGVIAKLLLSDLGKYDRYLASIASIHPEFASAIVGRWSNESETPAIPWRKAIDLTEALLQVDSVWDDKSFELGNLSWQAVRLAIARLLELGFGDAKRELPSDLLFRARGILLKLIDDPDPDLNHDRPPSDYFGHNDPITVALNHVRPVALSALIDYAWKRYRMTGAAGPSEGEVSDHGHLEPEIRHALDRKLDKKLDPSRAVHSVFGQYLPWLYRMDRQWVQENLRRIFPVNTDEESVWFYVAAWDAYVFNRYRSDLMGLLRPQYTQAIHNVGRGYFIKSHLDSAQHLAVHVAFEYLFSDYDLESAQGRSSLIVEFFTKTPPEVRHKAAWAVWRICQDNPSEFGRLWPRARAVWQWRSREASVSNHSSDFAEEMEQFAQLLIATPGTEELRALWPLLESLLPYIGRSEYRNRAWESVEKHLSTQVERYPRETIRFYRLMYERRSSRPRWTHHSDESRKIIETAAKDLGSRGDTLGLIDILAGQGDYTFRDVYERYSN